MNPGNFSFSYLVIFHSIGFCTKVRKSFGLIVSIRDTTKNMQRNKFKLQRHDEISFRNALKHQKPENLSSIVTKNSFIRSSVGMYCQSQSDLIHVPCFFFSNFVSKVSLFIPSS